MMRSVFRTVVLASAALALIGTGCGQKTKDLVEEAKMRLIAKDYQGALAIYDEALKSDAKSYDALWGKAQALGSHGEFSKEQEILEKILADADLMKKYGPNVKEALDRSYRTAASNLPKEAEGFLKKAIALDPQSAARSQLAHLYYDAGEKASKAGNFADAKTSFDKVATVDVGKKLKRDAGNQADLAGFLDFKGKFAPDFDKAKEAFIKDGTLDAANGRFVVEATADAPGSPKDKDFEANAEKAAVAAARNTLTDIVYKLHGTARPDQNPAPFEDTDLTTDTKSWAKPNKTYKVKVSAPIDAVTFQVYRVRNPRAAEAAEPEKK